MGYKLRDYQEKAVAMSRESIVTNKHIVIQVATGSGKTIIASDILISALAKGLRCAFIVDRIALVSQTAKVLSELGVDFGVHQGLHEKEDDSKQMQVCSIQTLSRRQHKPFDLVIIDEVHLLHKAHRDLLSLTQYAIGLSATPWRSGLGKYFHDLIIPIKTHELVDQGYLLPHKVLGPATIDVAGLKKVAGDFKKGDVDERANKSELTGKIVDHWIAHAQGVHRKTICFATSIAHARNIAKEFNKKGVKAVDINSRMKSEQTKKQKENGEYSEREFVMSEFTVGDAEIIVSVGILSIGFDYPEASCVILARPTASQMLHVQMIGRVLRIGGADVALVLDHCGNVERLGFADEINIEYLSGGDGDQVAKRKKSERKEPLPKPCPSCEAMLSAGTIECPFCGVACLFHEELEETSEALVEIDRKKLSKSHTTADKSLFLASLNTYALLHGFREGKRGCYGWSIYSYKDRYGVLPSNRIKWNVKHGNLEIPKEDLDWIEEHLSKRKLSGSQNQVQNSTIKQTPVQQGLPWGTSNNIS